MDKILVLDFGGQYCHLIASRIRRLGVLAEIAEPTVLVDQLKDVKGIVLSGGPAGVYETDAPKWNRELLDTGIPILGICYGHQLLMHELGGTVKRGEKQEYGSAQLQVTLFDPLLKPLVQGMSESETVWMSHGDIVTRLPAGFEPIGSTSNCAFAFAADLDKKIIGLQFHPEVQHTRCGNQLLKNFLEWCNCKKEWNIESYFEHKSAQIRQVVANKKVFLLSSGGVDSTVCFAWLSKILGKERVVGLHVDTGFMRQNESKRVQEALNNLGFDNLKVVDASDYFFSQLDAIADPEEKRVRIGNAFLAVQEQELQKIRLNDSEWILAQGTIYPDTIESGRTTHSKVIKTHHNRVPQVLEMLQKGQILEPLDGLYKDEVRELGEKLGLPHELVWRHPFPGPGLAIRALCKSQQQNGIELNGIIQQVNSLVAPTELKAGVLAIQSVGVQGDNRTYRHPAVLSGSANWQKLEQTSTQLTNEAFGINRVIWLVQSKTNSFDVQPAFLSRERIALLQKIDELVFERMQQAGLWNQTWQFPVVLIPIASKPGHDSVVLRPVLSTDAMTVRFAELPQEFVRELAAEILKEPQIENVFFDVTHKPPGTIEWE